MSSDFDFVIQAKTSTALPAGEHFDAICKVLALRPRFFFRGRRGRTEAIGGKAARHTFKGVEVWFYHVGQKDAELLGIEFSVVDPGWNGKNRSGEMVGEARKTQTKTFRIEDGKLLVVKNDGYGSVETVALNPRHKDFAVGTLIGEFLSDTLHGVRRAVEHSGKAYWRDEDLRAIGIGKLPDGEQEETDTTSAAPPPTGTVKPAPARSRPASTTPPAKPAPQPKKATPAGNGGGVDPKAVEALKRQLDSRPQQ